MEDKKKDATAPDPAPDPAPTAGRLYWKPTTTCSYFDVRSLNAGNKHPSTSTTPTAPPGSTGPKDIPSIAVDIGAKLGAPPPPPS